MDNIFYDLPIPPTLFADIGFTFNHDFPINEIDTIFGFSPTESKRQANTLINPITKVHNPGFWIFRTPECVSFDIKPLLNIIECFIKTYSSAIHKVNHIYSPSSFMLQIYVVVKQEDEFPAIRLSPDFLELVLSYNATIDFLIENDYS